MTQKLEKPVFKRPSGDSLPEVSDLAGSGLKKRSGIGGKSFLLSVGFHLLAALIACAFVFNGYGTGESEGNSSESADTDFQMSPPSTLTNTQSHVSNPVNTIRKPTLDVAPAIVFPTVSPGLAAMPMQPVSLSNSLTGVDFSNALPGPSAGKSSASSTSRSKSNGKSGSGSERPTQKSKPISPPKLLKAPPPRYPANAKAAGITGKTAVLVRVNGDGSAQSTSLYHSSGNAELDAAAVTAARGWKFSSSPELAAGKTTSVVVHVTFAL